MLISPHSSHHKHFVEVSCSLTLFSTEIKGKGALQRELRPGICFQHQPLSQHSPCPAVPTALSAAMPKGISALPLELSSETSVVSALPCIPGVPWSAPAAETVMVHGWGLEGLVEGVLQDVDTVLVQPEQRLTTVVPTLVLDITPSPSSSSLPAPSSHHRHSITITFITITPITPSSHHHHLPRAAALAAAPPQCADSEVPREGAAQDHQ